MFCTKCGKEIDNGASVCPYCNSNTQAPEANAAEPATQPAPQPTQPVYYSDNMAGGTAAVKKPPNKKLLFIIGGAVFAVIAIIVIIAVIAATSGSAEKTATKYLDAWVDGDCKTLEALQMPFGEKRTKYEFTEEYFDDSEYLYEKYDGIEDYYAELEEKYQMYYYGKIENAADAYEAYIAYCDWEIIDDGYTLDDYEIIHIKEYDRDSSRLKKFVEEWEDEIDGEDFDFDREFFDQEIKKYAEAIVKFDRDEEEEILVLRLFKLGRNWYVYIPSN
ncbi:MAG: hypothetical protein ACI4IG_00095 [Eubacterium sp.]